MSYPDGRSSRFRSSPAARSRGALQGTILAGIAAMGVVGLTTFGVLAGTDGFLTVLLVLLASLSLVFAASDKAGAVAILLIAAGLAQGAVAAVSGSPRALWLDDICLLGVVFVVVARLARANNARAMVAGIAFAALIGFAYVNGAGAEIGFYQARQLLVPALLLYFGAVIRLDELARFARFLYATLILNFLYMSAEFFGYRPISPWLATGLNEFSVSSNALESGRELPGNYYYYFGDAGGQVLFRSGGLHFNPPGEGIFMASVALYVRQFLKTPLRWILYGISAAGAAFTVGRAGGVVLLLTAAQIRVSRIVTRVGFVLLSVAGAFVLSEYFSEQGNSGSHADGLTVGFLHGLTHPLGGGFGTIGNASESAMEEAGESLLGMFFASCGWAAIVIVGWLLFRAMQAGFTVPGVALTAAVAASLFTESMSGLAVAAPLWIMAGQALRPEWRTTLRSKYPPQHRHTLE